MQFAYIMDGIQGNLSGGGVGTRGGKRRRGGGGGAGRTPTSRRRDIVRVEEPVSRSGANATLGRRNSQEFGSKGKGNKFFCGRYVMTRGGKGGVYAGSHSGVASGDAMVDMAGGLRNTMMLQDITNDDDDYDEDDDDDGGDDSGEDAADDVDGVNVGDVVDGVNAGDDVGVVNADDDVGGVNAGDDVDGVNAGGDVDGENTDVDVEEAGNTSQKKWIKCQGRKYVSNFSILVYDVYSCYKYTYLVISIL